MRWAMAAVAGLLATTTATTAAAAAVRPGVRTISYETGPCFGTCPVYRVTVSSDGRGVFEGRRFTGVAGRREFRVTPAEWRAFSDRLQALHGRGTVDLTGPPLCRPVVSDMPSVEVRWSGAWRAHTLKADYGCQSAQTAWMYPHLRGAPDALPIAAFVKPDRPLPPGR